MKKIFNLLLMAVALLGINTSCSDVPAPYNLSDSGSGSESIEPAGTGTAADPYNVGMALRLLADGEIPTTKVYVKGIISKIDEIDTSNYGNATYYISDDGTTTKQLEVYRGLGLNGNKFKTEEDIKVGDKVIVYGQVLNYNGTYEFTQGSEIVAINDDIADLPEAKDEIPEGDGTLDKPYNPAQANAVCAELESGASTGVVYVRGYITSIKECSAQYGNCTFNMSTDGTNENAFYVYRALGLGNKNVTDENFIKVGDDVVVCGKLTNYNGTYETVQKGAYVYSVNGGGNNNEVPGAGESSKEKPFTVAEAKTATGKVGYVKGYIIGYIDGTKLAEGAKFEIPAAQETEVLIADNADETNVDNAFPVQLPTGDIRSALDLYTNPTNLKKQVVVYGSIETYFGTAGMKSTSWTSIGGKEYGKDPDVVETPGEATGSGTLSDPYNVAGVIAYINTLGSETSAQEVYVKGKVSSNTTTEATITQYGNMTFTIVDEGKTATFTAFQVYAPGKVKFTSVDQIKVGDEVVVCGKVLNYKGNTPETVSKGEAYVYSINGKTEGGNDNGGDNGNNGTTAQDENISISDNVVTLSNPSVTPQRDKTEVITFTGYGFTNGQDLTDQRVTADGCTITFGKGTAEKNTPKYYDASTGPRIYPGNTMTITGTNAPIATVVIECDVYQGTNCVGQATATVTSSGNTMTYTNAGTGTGTATQLRPKKMTVTYGPQNGSGVRAQRFAKHK